LYSNRDSATLEREAGLLQLLVELDGFETKSSAGSKQEMVLVMGATNLSAQLDPALLRSGRFERSFNINVPSTHKDRLAILKVHARKLNIPRGGNEKWDEDALLNRTTELTHGYSGASLAALLNEASILSVRANREFVNIEDIERVLERNLVGVASAPMEDGWGKDHLAMVEAGRAVLWSSKSSKQYCPTVLRVTIKPHGTKTTGVMLQQETTEHQWTEDDARATSLDEYIDGLALLHAGRCVETVFFGPQGVSVQTKGDLVAAVDIAYDIATSSGVYPDSKKGLRPYWPEELIEHFRLPAAEMDAGVHDLMMRAHIRAEEYVQYYKPVILQVASELLAHESLYGTHIKDLVNEHEVKMAVAKDESLAKAQAKKEDAENRKRKDKEFEDETNERRRAASAEKTEQVESRGVAGAIDVDSSDEPLSSDPFGTSETAGVVDDNFKGVLGRAMRSVGRRGGAFPESERKPEDEDEDADAKK
jgi:cell division protease FtsH